ncbi:GRAM domain-containing protein [Rutstroemia sp. NJR-2017a BBW]|nr:GRAM domain-containing protein [Rutstroemia sp. NJR-2017a BBW]
MDDTPDSPTTSHSSRSGLTAMFSKTRAVRKPARDSATASLKSTESDTTTHGVRASLDGALEKLKSGLTEDDSTDSNGATGLKKLVSKPFESKRRRKQREDEERELEEVARGRSVAERGTLKEESRNSSFIRQNSGDRDGSSLLTYDSETESPLDTPPPLSTHPSHIGYLTTSSPLINSSTVPDTGPLHAHLDGVSKSSIFPNSTDSLAASESTNGTPSQKLRAPTDGSQRRSPSPVGRLKEVFKPKRGTSPNTSPDRKAGGGGAESSLNTKDGGADSRRGSVNAKFGSLISDIPLPQAKPRSTASSPERPRSGKVKPIDTTARPQTPPPTDKPAPIIVNTPPTPTDPSSPRFPISNSNSPTAAGSNVVTSPSGNMISHRRIRSGSGTLGPSKLSNITSAPLTPTPENGATTPGQGGFFSSVFSAAQNAANTLSNSITNTSSPSGGTRSRSGAQEAQQIQTPQVESPEVEAIGEQPDSGNFMEEKELAVKTLGQGDLSLSHLGITEDTNTTMPKSTTDESRGRSDSAREEDTFAGRAVTAPNILTGENLEAVSTPQVEDLQSIARPRSNYEPSTAGDQTPPNGSVFEGKTGIHRSGSIRSAINHRKRGSSAATGTTISTAIAAANSSIANPSQGTPKITGFAVASKKRNRDFHALFRSVPEDDYLIEDYSCALQREILAHGRLYVSEGHLCFSSNIFGWVTTLVMSFDEIVSVEKRSTAMIFKNGLMISTLHSKNIFASFTSRDSTYDLIVGIWKIGHPSLRSSLNGVTLEETGGGDKTEKDDGIVPSRPGSASQSSDDSEGADGDIYDEDEDDEDGMSFTQADGSVAGSEPGEKVVSRKASAAAVTNGVGSEGTKEDSPTTSGDFPGPATHAPTGCTDGDTHYAKILTDEVIPAPLGKVYNLMFGPASLTWMRNWLTNEQKCLEFTMEEKVPLNLDNKVRNYSYIKPLSGAIGPKQTKCVCTETLDFMDLEKSISVTISTATPDVPSGNVFSTKTKYCLSWGENNGTRLQMSCAIEWTGKSWLKGPIEKGANDGQVQYTKDVVAALKSAVSTRRATATGASGGKGKKKGKKGQKVNNLSKSTDGSSESKPAEANWGLFEPVRPILSPVVDILKPLMTSNIMYGLLVGLLVASWFRFGTIGGGSRDSVGMGYIGTPERIAAYEEIWRREESELWLWLEDRAGMDRLREVGRMPIERQDIHSRYMDERDAGLLQEKEVERAIKVTEEKLRVLKDVVEKEKIKNKGKVSAENGSS